MNIHDQGTLIPSMPSTHKEFRDNVRFIGSIEGISFFGVMLLILATSLIRISDEMDSLAGFFSLLGNFLLLVLPALGFGLSIHAWRNIKLEGVKNLSNIGFYGFVLFGTQLLSIILMMKFFSYRVGVVGGFTYWAADLLGLIISAVIWLTEYLKPEKAIL